MKLFINGLSAKFGGGELYLKMLLENIEEQNIEITLFCSEHFPVPTKNQITIIKKSKLLSHPIIRPLWEKFCLRKILKDGNYDVLFCPGGTSSTTPPPSCKMAITFQNMLPFSPVTLKLYKLTLFRAKMKLLRIALMKTFLKADLIIFISHYAKNVTESLVGAHLKSKVVIHHGVTNLSQIEPVHPLNATPYLLYVSILTPYKNQLAVIEAFRLLKQEDIYSGKLILAGRSDTRYGQLAIKKVHEIGMSDQIIFTNNLNHTELHSYYTFAEGYIFASECENCPNILLEKMQYKKPIMTSNMAPMDELAGPGAIYFNPRSPQDTFAGFKSLVLRIKNQNTIDYPALKTWQDTAHETWATIIKLSKEED